MNDALRIAEALLTNSEGLVADRLALRMDGNESELGGYRLRELAEKIDRLLREREWHPADPPGFV